MKLSTIKTHLTRMNPVMATTLIMIILPTRTTELTTRMIHLILMKTNRVEEN